MGYAMKCRWTVDRISLLRRHGATTRLAIADACQALAMWSKRARTEYGQALAIDGYNNALAWHRSETVFANSLVATLSARMVEKAAALAVEYLFGPSPSFIPGLDQHIAGARLQQVDPEQDLDSEQDFDPEQDFAGGTIQEVVHHEEAAAIPPETASEIAAEQWARWTIQNVGAASSTGGPSVDIGADGGPYQPVYLLRLKRNPRELETAIHEGPELEPVRDAMTRVGFSSRLPSGAAMLVEPDHYETVRHMLATISLRPYHIIVQETFYPLLIEAISHVRSRAGARVTDSRMLGYVGPDDAFVIENTFFSGTPSPMRNPQSVVQSTTAVHGAVNPRRY